MDHRAIRHGADGMIALRLLLPLIAFLAMLAPQPAAAWGEFGHRTTGEIAWANVQPQTRAGIFDLVKASSQLGTPDCAIRTLADASYWPDCLRRDGWRWGYTFAWHYRTAPICEAYNPRANCSGGNCILAQIERNQRILADESLPANVRLEAMAFLVHFIGDVHMPLHSGDKDDRGGNDRAAQYGIVPGLNLHWVWDGPLAERAITDTRDNVVRRYTAEERAALGGGDSAEWGRESWSIAREIVYPNAFEVDDACGQELPDSTVLTQRAIVAAAPVANRRIRQAGIRMAEYLDAAFAPGPLPEPAR
ncbi:S1/P1 nuclease [Pseudoblastomonas flavescens]|uniref:S1/P1 nuclease n=2 Tax=Alteriqipengyuania flavescens TaxID=3053610 RepID=UPI0025B3EE90|nr:S1/P1 nuclease [Alteriqipengyuania flavescens]WJY17443.1 S1/P1 nuclease [Alteriqipengyuania flavescens]